MQISRLFEIVYLLLNRKRTTANELAEHFEVSRRTILRDIETLSQAGIPICTVPGKGGGISIMDGFILNKTAVSEEEQNQILFALQGLGAAGHVEVSEVLPRLRALFDKNDTDWIEVDLSRWGNAEADKEKFEVLKNAVINKNLLSFIYAGSNGEIAERTVYPLKLVFKSKSWYLQAYCRMKQDYRTFKISRIQSLQLLSEKFSGEDFLKQGCSGAGSSLPPIDDPGNPPARPVHLVLWISPGAAYRVFDEFDAKYVTIREDGSFLVTVDLPEDNWLYSFLLSFGAAAKVLEPPRVRERLIKQLAAIQKLYLGNKI